MENLIQRLFRPERYKMKNKFDRGLRVYRRIVTEENIVSDSNRRIQVFRDFQFFLDRNQAVFSETDIMGRKFDSPRKRKRRKDLRAIVEVLSSDLSSTDIYIIFEQTYFDDIDSGVELLRASTNFHKLWLVDKYAEFIGIKNAIMLAREIYPHMRFPYKIAKYPYLVDGLDIRQEVQYNMMNVESRYLFRDYDLIRSFLPIGLLRTRIREVFEYVIDEAININGRPFALRRRNLLSIGYDALNLLEQEEVEELKKEYIPIVVSRFKDSSEEFSISANRLEDLNLIEIITMYIISGMDHSTDLAEALLREELLLDQQRLVEILDQVFVEEDLIYMANHIDKYRMLLALIVHNKGYSSLPKELIRILRIQHSNSNITMQMIHEDWYICGAGEKIVEVSLTKGLIHMLSDFMVIKLLGKMTAVCTHTVSSDHGTFVTGMMYSPLTHRELYKSWHAKGIRIFEDLPDRSVFVLQRPYRENADELNSRVSSISFPEEPIVDYRTE